SSALTPLGTAAAPIPMTPRLINARIIRRSVFIVPSLEPRSALRVPTLGAQLSGERPRPRPARNEPSADQSSYEPLSLHETQDGSRPPSSRARYGGAGLREQTTCAAQATHERSDDWPGGPLPSVQPGVHRIASCSLANEAPQAYCGREGVSI